jgi:hypothetical protein
MSTLPAAQALGTSPAILGPAVRITSGPYNGLKGNLAKQCDTFSSIVIEFEKAWFEIVTETRWLAPLSDGGSPSSL